MRRPKRKRSAAGLPAGGGGGGYGSSFLYAAIFWTLPHRPGRSLRLLQRLRRSPSKRADCGPLQLLSRPDGSQLGQLPRRSLRPDQREHPSQPLPRPPGTGYHHPLRAQAYPAQPGTHNQADPRRGAGRRKSACSATTILNQVKSGVESASLGTLPGDRLHRLLGGDEKIADLGIRKYLHKPVSTMEMTTAVRQALDGN